MRKLLLAVVVVMLCALSSHLPSCPIMLPEAVFTLRYNPQADAAAIAAGKLGVIQHKYFRKYLAVSYRYLSGVPLMRLEQAHFLAGDNAKADDAKANWL